MGQGYHYQLLLVNFVFLILWFSFLFSFLKFHYFVCGTCATVLSVVFKHSFVELVLSFCIIASVLGVDLESGVTLLRFLLL